MTEKRTQNGDLTVIILTHNEELNLPQALDSVKGWADKVFVVDSQSTDATAAIASKYGCHVVEHPFENYARQRNYALNHLPIQTEWVLFLDADEWLPDELKREISEVIGASPLENGFEIKFRFIWMGRWIRRGYYPSWILRLFRHGKARCEDRPINEQMIIDGAVGRMRHDFIHEDRKGVGEWIAKHRRYAVREARELLNIPKGDGYREAEVRLLGRQGARKRWFRYRVWNRLPPLVRPVIYFSYRYIAAGGFLDGRAGLLYHVLHALWYPALIDVKYLDMKLRQSRGADVRS